MQMKLRGLHIRIFLLCNYTELNVYHFLLFLIKTEVTFKQPYGVRKHKTCVSTISKTEEHTHITYTLYIFYERNVMQFIEKSKQKCTPAPN